MWLFLAILSAFFASLVAIFGKIGLENIDSTLATTLRSAVMFLLLLLISLLLKKFNLLFTINHRALAFIILSGLAGALSWLFYFLALKLGPAAKVGPIDKLSILFIILLAFLFLGEKITWKIIIGGSLMLVGAIFLAL